MNILRSNLAKYNKFHLTRVELIAADYYYFLINYILHTLLIEILTTGRVENSSANNKADYFLIMLHGTI